MSFILNPYIYITEVYPSILSVTANSSGNGVSIWNYLSSSDLSNCDMAIIVTAPGTVGNRMIVTDTGTSSGWTAVAANVAMPGGVNSSVGKIYYKINPTSSETVNLKNDPKTGASDGATTNIGAMLIKVNSADGILCANSSNNTAQTTSDPPNLDIGSVKKTQWIAGTIFFSATPQSGIPSGYSSNTDLGWVGATSCQMSIALNQTQAQTENPSTWTIPSSRWGAFTLGLYTT